MYNSKYYTCEQIDQRLLEGYYDDAVAAGYTGSKAQYLAGLLQAINYSANPNITADKVAYNSASGLYKNVQEALDGIARQTSKIKGTITQSDDLDSKKENSDIGLWFVNRRPDPGIVLVCYDFEKHYVQVKLSATRNVSVNETTNKPSIQYRKYIDNAWTEWTEIEFNFLKTHILQADGVAIQDTPLNDYIKAIINPEMAGKFDKASIAQEFGDSEELVMSQKAVSDSLYSLTEEAVGYSDFEDIKGRLSVAQNNKILINGVVTNQNNGFITTPLQVYKGDTVKITANYYDSYRLFGAIAIDNGDSTYTVVRTGHSSNASDGTATYEWTATKDCMVVFSGKDWNTAAKIYLLRVSKVETKVNNLVWKKRIIEFNTKLTPGMPLLTKITLGQTFPFGGKNNSTNILRGIFEVKEGEKVYFSTLPEIQNNFSGCAVLDKDYIVISLTPASNEIYFEVPAGGKYVVFQALTASGYPTIYVESLENTTEEIDTTDLELLQNPTINCLQFGRAYIFGDIGTKVTESDNWKNVDTKCYSCVPGDIFYITCTCINAYGTFAVVGENNVILAKDTRPTGFWHYMTKVVVPEGGAKLLVDNDLGNLCVYKKKVTRNIYPEKESLVAATSLVTVGSNYSDRRLRLSWASDTHADANLYKRWIDWTNIHIGMLDAALHTGDFNRMADADNGFVVTALKYRTMLPFLPTLGNHDCFGQTPSTNTLNSGSLEWNGNKYIKPFVENDSACVVSNDGCYYYRDFTDKKIRMIVINDYDKPRWADGTYWITTTDESEIASAVEWTSGTSYAVGDVIHYKGMYVKCKTAGVLDDKAHVWKPNNAVLSKTITDCRYINQAQADFIVNAMNVDSGWGIIFVTHQPYEALPASEHCISKWTLRRDLVNTYVGVKFGQNGYMIQDLITAYLNKTTLNKTYECITPNVNPLASNVVKTNLPDFYPDVTINVDFTNAVGDVICCLNGHQHSDTAYWSQHTGEKKVLCIGAPTDCYLPFDSWSSPWPSGDIAKSGGAKDCFNAISIDTTEKAVYLVRIGADKTDQFETRDYIRISYAHN